MKPGWRQRARSEEQIGRRRGHLAARRLILVVCEDAKSSPKYFEALRKQLRLSTARVEICGEQCGSAPISVVDYAIKRRSECLRAGDLVDVVYCVVDVDKHDSLHQALDKARPNQLEMAVSSPCFELWYLLHFSPGGRPYANCEQLIRELKKSISGYDKGTFRDFDPLWERMYTAINNAKRLVDLRGDQRLRNPSTDVYVVVETFIAEARSGPPLDGPSGSSLDREADRSANARRGGQERTKKRSAGR